VPQIVPRQLLMASAFLAFPPTSIPVYSRGPNCRRVHLPIGKKRIGETIWKILIECN
jgi:hypothetical protein